MKFDNIVSEIQKNLNYFDIDNLDDEIKAVNKKLLKLRSLIPTFIEEIKKDLAKLQKNTDLSYPLKRCFKFQLEKFDRKTFHFEHSQYIEKHPEFKIKVNKFYLGTIKHDVYKYTEKLKLPKTASLKDTLRSFILTEYLELIIYLKVIQYNFHMLGKNKQILLNNKLEDIDGFFVKIQIPPDLNCFLTDLYSDDDSLLNLVSKMHFAGINFEYLSEDLIKLGYKSSRIKHYFRVTPQSYQAYVDDYFMRKKSLLR